MAIARQRTGRNISPNPIALPRQVTYRSGAMDMDLCPSV